MKKRRIAKVLPYVACLAGMACIVSLGIKNYNLEVHADEQYLIIQKTQEDLDYKTMETEKLESVKSDLQSELDSARREEQELERAVDKLTGEVEELERKRASYNVSRGAFSGGTPITVKVTGYCPCEICCGEWAYKNPGITASGTVAKYGTVAAPASIPFGTKLMIEGYGDQIFTVEDTGSAVVYSNGVYVIDMWMPTHEQAYNIGNKVVQAVILN